jgi:hemerythrin-like domain-containing protein
MPIQIGGKRESDFNDPIGMLGDCHRRILNFLNVLVTLANQHKGGPLSEEQRGLLANSLRYFRDAAPKHTADEEDSLFPRLRELDVPGLEIVLARIDALQQDHESADLQHAEVDRLGQRWLLDGRLSSEDAARLTEILGRLEALYRDHIRKEDTQVFPFAQRVLPPDDRRSIGAEMAARRNIPGSGA